MHAECSNSPQKGPDIFLRLWRIKHVLGFVFAWMLYVVHEKLIYTRSKTYSDPVVLSALFCVLCSFPVSRKFSFFMSAGIISTFPPFHPALNTTGPQRCLEGSRCQTHQSLKSLPTTSVELHNFQVHCSHYLYKINSVGTFCLSLSLSLRKI